MVQIIRQVCGDEAGPRSGQEVNLQVSVRSGEGNEGQTPPSYHQAGVQ